MRLPSVSHRLWVAWCVELNHPMTPYDALRAQLNNPQESLTFHCIGCHRSVLFGQQRRGFLTHPNFRRYKGDSHDHCLHDLSGKTPLTPDVRFYQDLEAIFALIASQARKLSKTLTEFETSFLNKKEAMQYLEGSHTLLKASVAASNQVYDILESSLRESEKLYKDFRLTDPHHPRKED